MLVSGMLSYVILTSNNMKVFSVPNTGMIKMEKKNKKICCYGEQKTGLSNSYNSLRIPKYPVNLECCSHRLYWQNETQMRTCCQASEIPCPFALWATKCLVDLRPSRKKCIMPNSPGLFFFSRN